MSRKFIAAIALASLVSASWGAAPARADDRDTARAIAGIAALVIIGKALSDRNDKRHEQTIRHNKPRVNHGHVYQAPQHVRPKPNPQHVRPMPPRVQKMTLPRRCLTTVRARGRNMNYMNRQCLQNNYRWAGQLPRNCTVRVQGNRGTRVGYSAQCLRQQGYRLNG
ncbi:hypothetical protein [Lentibacter sp. XHP0401]|jgi:hypothetical protein|uniref:hypothetical protein n=1 Tax=Lentibacter sp. XHP0401 TaxID=2984334 RepID=UPI0021E94552|nr:hypothetical protein [Lentibacter sp. XHP0401]MCV2892689.1 hypothetical protein [Lentibacter sp. XHP0401]